MLSQKVNSLLSLVFLAVLAFGASYLIVRVSQADDLQFTTVDLYDSEQSGELTAK